MLSFSMVYFCSVVWWVIPFVNLDLGGLVCIPSWIYLAKSTVHQTSRRCRWNLRSTLFCRILQTEILIYILEQVMLATFKSIIKTLYSLHSFLSVFVGWFFRSYLTVFFVFLGYDLSIIPFINYSFFLNKTN